MQKYFTPYPLALRLKAIGFNEPCFAFFNGKHLDFNVWDWEYPAGQKRRDIGECPLAPTFEQAFDWFIENHELFPEFCYQHWTKNYASMIYPDTFYVCDCTFFEAKIKCLERLIEIVERKK